MTEFEVGMQFINPHDEKTREITKLSTSVRGKLVGITLVCLDCISHRPLTLTVEDMEERIKDKLYIAKEKQGE